MKISSNPALTYGVLAGLGICLLSLVLYLSGLDAFLKYAWFNYLILIIFGVIAGLAQKKAHGGILEFADALKVVFGTMVLALLIQMVFNYILLNLVDVSFAEALKQASIDKGEEIMRKFGAPSEEIDSYLDKAAKDNPNSFKNMFFGFAIWSIVAFLVALIISAIIKRNKPAFENSFKEL